MRLLLALLILSSCVLLSQQQTVIFSDDFDEFDLTVWDHEITMSGGGNWEFEMYINNRSNSYVENGALVIQPTYLANVIGAENLMTADFSLWGGEPADLCTSNAFYGCERVGGGGGNIINPIQSARIRTVNSFSFKYGRIEVVAKLPRGDWLWPAIWLLPVTNSYGNWPASGEIDIMESRGNPANYSAGGINQFGSTLHWGPFDPIDAYSLTHETYTIPEGDLGDDYHTYGLYWDNTTLYTYFDNDTNVVLKVSFEMSMWEQGGFNPAYQNPWRGRGNNAPFDQQYFLLINLAVGGTNGYFPDGVGGKPWTDADDNAPNEFWNAEASQWGPTWTQPFYIDKVTVWSL